MLLVAHCYKDAGCIMPDNAFAEPFNARVRAECLNANWFLSLADARHKCETWRRDYNEVRPHMALGNLSPVEFLAGSGFCQTPIGSGKSKANVRPGPPTQELQSGAGLIVDGPLRGRQIKICLKGSRKIKAEMLADILGGPCVRKDNARAVPHCAEQAAPD